jgi:integrase
MSITPRGHYADGREKYEVRVGFLSGGKYTVLSRTVAGKRAAQALERDLWVKARAGKLATGKLTFRAYFEQWAKHRESLGERAKRTVQDNRHKAKAALDRFGKLRLDRITRPMVKDWKESLSGSGTYRHHQFVVFKQVMEEARRDGLVPVNPAADLPAPAMDRPRKQALTEAQVKELLKALEPNPQLHAVTVLMLATGTRPGEALALRWSRVNLDDGTVTIDSAMDGDGTVKGTKTGSERTIPIGAETVTVLKAQRARIAAKKLECPGVWTDDDFVFPELDTRQGLAGRGWRPSSFHHQWRDALKAANKDRKQKLEATPGQCRHTTLNRWRTLGLRMEAVQYLAGHSQGSAVTGRVYTRHVTDTEIEAVRG